MCETGGDWGRLGATGERRRAADTGTGTGHRSRARRPTTGAGGGGGGEGAQREGAPDTGGAQRRHNTQHRSMTASQPAHRDRQSLRLRLRSTPTLHSTAYSLPSTLTTLFLTTLFCLQIATMIRSNNANFIGGRGVTRDRSALIKAKTHRIYAAPLIFGTIYDDEKKIDSFF